MAGTRTRRIGGASSVLALLSTMTGRPAEAGPAPLPLTVAVYEYAALPPPVLERARGVATSIYKRIGVPLHWVEGPHVHAEVATGPVDCRDSSTPLIHLGLLRRSADPRRPAGDLGFAVPGARLASVLVERIEYVANSKEHAVGDLLGFVMAHEIGHLLLLPPDAHSRMGVMAAKIDFFLIAHGAPSFDPGQARMIRARIASMCRGE